MKILKGARNLIGISQYEMAERLGVKQGIISAWERGTNEPPIGRIPDIAREYRIAPEELLDIFMGKNPQATVSIQKESA